MNINASINYKSSLFFATFQETCTRSSENVIGLAEQLIEIGIFPEDITLGISTFENKFQDVMINTANQNAFGVRALPSRPGDRGSPCNSGMESIQFNPGHILEM